MHKIYETDAILIWVNQEGDSRVFIERKGSDTILEIEARYPDVLKVWGKNDSTRIVSRPDPVYFRAIKYK